MVSRDKYKNTEEKTFSNSLYCRNVNDLTLANSYKTVSQQILLTEHFPPDTWELSQNVVDSLADYATTINI